MKKKIYISGKMSGLNKDDYQPKFAEAEKKLKAEGYIVFNPADDSWQSWLERLGKTYTEILFHDIQQLMHCDAIYMLDNFLESKGAKAEHAFAVAAGLDIIYDDELYNQGILRH